LLPETGGKSLEEIAELFGDTLASDLPKDVKIEDSMAPKVKLSPESEPPGPFHVERAA